MSKRRGRCVSPPSNLEHLEAGSDHVVRARSSSTIDTRLARREITILARFDLLGMRQATLRGTRRVPQPAYPIKGLDEDVAANALSALLGDRCCRMAPASCGTRPSDHLRPVIFSGSDCRASTRYAGSMDSRTSPTSVDSMPSAHGVEDELLRIEGSLAEIGRFLRASEHHGRPPRLRRHPSSATPVRLRWLPPPVFASSRPVRRRLPSLDTATNTRCEITLPDPTPAPSVHRRRRWSGRSRACHRFEWRRGAGRSAPRGPRA